MNIVSWNINGIRAITEKDFRVSVEKMKPDIICIQETKAQENQVIRAFMHFKNYNLYPNSADKRGYSGTAVLSTTKPIIIENNMGVMKYNAEGRIICLEYDDFYLVNVYVPNSGQKLKRLAYRKEWDKDFLKYLNNLQKKKPVVVCGDFNVAHQPIDLKNDKLNYNKTAGYTQIEIDGMDAFITSGFVDIFRFLHPNEIAYTFWSYRFKARERNIGWRIDYFLISQSLICKIKSVQILDDIYGSDHCPIELEINL
jgi:exodeoxyribonuclease-3